MKISAAAIVSFIIFLLSGFSPVFAQVSRVELDEVMLAFDKSFSSTLKKNGQKLVINEPLPFVELDWHESPIMNASYVQYEQNSLVVHSLTIMGGILKLKGVTQDTAALILCHELGHGIGGPPFKDDSGFTDYVTSTEAQADYFSTFVCAPEIWKNLHPEKSITKTVDKGRCLENSCRRSFEAMKGFVIYQKSISQTSSSIQFDSSDLSQSKTLIKDYDFYPSPQCRLDTLMNGALGLPRPSCWYP